MSGLLRALDCDFCAPLVADSVATVRHLANRVVATCGKMLLVADHAPMTLGHLLLIPRDHYTAMASFVADDPYATTAVNAIRHRYRDAFGACTVIEHGSQGEPTMTGPCIDHAHWHLLPFHDELAPIVDGDHGGAMRRIGSLADLATYYTRADYLLCWDTTGARVALPDVGARRPQYARSVVARHLDASAMPHDWDWALRTDDELLVKTLAAARAAFTEHETIAKPGNAENPRTPKEIV